EYDLGGTRPEPASRAAPAAMRRVAVLAGTLVLVARPLTAQRAGQFEAGAFGAYTRYDPAFGLGQKPGGGVRLGYFLNNFIGVEGDVLFQPEYTVTPPGGTANTLQPLIAGASLVVNALRAPRLTLYALGGYSLLDFGTRAPYHFTDNAVHGGAGIRLFLTNRIAVRVEGRAIVTPSTKSNFGFQSVTHYLGTIGLSVLHLATLRNDSDGDGVPDSKDACPGTPAGAVVDQRGCPLDADQDGVPDGIDQCPNTPAGTKVDATGCPLPVEAVRAPTAQAAAPAKCPPAPPGSQVDANGCLVLFAPEPARPTAPGAPAPRPTLILRGVNFETGRSVLTRDSYLVLDAVAASLVANPEIRIEVGGYTDSTGTKFSNLRLSQARAAAVRFYLARKGVAPVRMVAKGYGASGYIAPNSTAAGPAQNRRVELHKLP